MKGFTKLPEGYYKLLIELESRGDEAMTLHLEPMLYIRNDLLLATANSYGAPLSKDISDVGTIIKLTQPTMVISHDNFQSGVYGDFVPGCDRHLRHTTMGVSLEELIDHVRSEYIRRRVTDSVATYVAGVVYDAPSLSEEAKDCLVSYVYALCDESERLQGLITEYLEPYMRTYSSYETITALKKHGLADCAYEWRICFDAGESRNVDLEIVEFAKKLADLAISSDFTKQGQQTEVSDPEEIETLQSTSE